MNRQLSIIFRAVLIVASSTSLAVGAFAQLAPQPPPAIKSLEVGVRDSKAIFLGKLVSFSATPNLSTKDAQFEVKETLRGQLANAAEVTLNVSEDVLNKWRSTSALVLVEIPLNPNAVSTAYDLSDPNLIFINSKLDLLTNPDEVVQAIREEIRRSPGDAVRTFPLPIPAPKLSPKVRSLLPDWARSHREVDLQVPIDKDLERLGLRDVESRKIDDRVLGARILADFKTPQNELTLRKLLTDPGSTWSSYPIAEYNQGIGVRYYPTRGAAFGSLRQWDPSLPEPIFSETVDTIKTIKTLTVLPDNDLEGTLERAQLAPKLDRLNIALYASTPLTPHQIYLVSQLRQLSSLAVENRGVNDDSLLGLTPLSNLQWLSLKNDLVTDNSIKTLLQFPKLKSLNLDGTHISYLGRRALLKERPSLEIAPKLPVMALGSRAECRNKIYALTDKELTPWASKVVGRLTGNLIWSQSPSGRTYLGPLGQQAVTLGLKNLPPHRNVTIDIDLWMIGSWDGGNPMTGPDVFDISVPTVGALLHSSFFNNTEGDGASETFQSFPDPYPLGWHKGYTGAAEERTLGFTEPWDGQIYHRDAVYQLHYTFPHSGQNLQVVFTGENTPQPEIDQLELDEHWGLENVVVKTD